VVGVATAPDVVHLSMGGFNAVGQYRGEPSGEQSGAWIVVFLGGLGVAAGCGGNASFLFSRAARKLFTVCNRHDLYKHYR
jgi:hypothetical protein